MALSHRFLVVSLHFTDECARVHKSKHMYARTLMQSESSHPSLLVTTCLHIDLREHEQTKVKLHLWCLYHASIQICESTRAHRLFYRCFTTETSGKRSGLPQVEAISHGSAQIGGISGGDTKWSALGEFEKCIFFDVMDLEVWFSCQKMVW